jgi:hypothetical protein
MIVVVSTWIDVVSAWDVARAVASPSASEGTRRIVRGLRERPKGANERLGRRTTVGSESSGGRANVVSESVGEVCGCGAVGCGFSMARASRTPPNGTDGITPGRPVVVRSRCGFIVARVAARSVEREKSVKQAYPRVCGRGAVDRSRGRGRSVRFEEESVWLNLPVERSVLLVRATSDRIARWEALSTALYGGKLVYGDATLWLNRSSCSHEPHSTAPPPTMNGRDSEVCSLVRTRRLARTSHTETAPRRTADGHEPPQPTPSLRSVVPRTCSSRALPNGRDTR